ncbi:MAG: aminoacyl-tRNA hydrolase [Sulfurospirillaceae bacterium]|nr:aminoacyl-tRNA hydrolase [Sulfurospirillaceae bacterium]MDD3462157.1 aminoacyl-tRNA hydrolase [Sulfurospirillaceae bacterium]
MTLIVGLGNPETQYKQNRHNIGFQVVDAIISDLKTASITKSAFKGILYKDDDTLFLKPTTYMNLSGESVRAVSDYFKVDKLIVIHDDLDLPFGTLRFKKGGGHGGHNGLRSIDAHIGSDYIRVRFGIGKPQSKEDVARYVLSDFLPCEKEHLKDIITQAKQAIFALKERELEEVASKYSLKQSFCRGE